VAIRAWRQPFSITLPFFLIVIGVSPAAAKPLTCTINNRWFRNSSIDVGQGRAVGSDPHTFANQRPVGVSEALREPHFSGFARPLPTAPREVVASRDFHSPDCLTLPMVNRQGMPVAFAAGSAIERQLAYMVTR
jgi:hypothetical protein